MDCKERAESTKKSTFAINDVNNSENNRVEENISGSKTNLFIPKFNHLPSTSQQNGPFVSQQALNNFNGRLSNNGNSELNIKDHKSDKDKCDDVPSTSKQNEHGENIFEHTNSEQNLPSTSGSSKINACSSGGKETVVDSRKRPSSLKLNNYNNEDNDSSSDTGNEEYSLGSEDGCIYTYRGGEHLADLPSSFFSLDMGLPNDNHLPAPPNYPLRGENPPVNREGNSRASSPDMDFLEMDFDPGPSCEADTGDESSPDANLEADIHMPDEEVPVLVREKTPEVNIIAIKAPLDKFYSVKSSHNCHVHCDSVPSTSRAFAEETSSSMSNNESFGKYIYHVNAKGEKLLVQRTTCHGRRKPLVSFHYCIGEPVSPRERISSELLLL